MFAPSDCPLLHRSPSTISREVRRNATFYPGKARSFYVPSKAHEHANGRRSRSRRVKHHAPEIYAHIEALLAETQWSPEQIANRLPEQLAVRLSHMTIYRHVRRDQRAGGVMFRHLRQGGKRRRPWERGSNENFNGLLRQYFRKGKSLAHIRQIDCNRITAKLNQRPRKRYGFQTPTQRLQQLSGVLHLEC